MHRNGPLIPALSLAAGIAASATANAPWWAGTFPVTIAITVYAIIMHSSGNPVKAFRLNRYHPIWILFLFLGIGMIDEALSRPVTIEEGYGGEMPSHVRCEVRDILSKTYGDRIEVEISGTNGARARIISGVTELSPGDIIFIPSALLKSIDSDTTETARKIAPMLKARGIFYSGMIPPKYIVTEGESHSPRYFFINLRQQIETKIEKSHLDRRTADFLKAILMGDKNGLDENTRLTFANGGTAHMLALSGLHLAIIAGFLLTLMWPARFAGKYKWGYAAAIVFLWIYVLLTGMSNSSVRACIMLTLAFTGVILERKNSTSAALCSACLLILLADPSALFDIGFQLSVTCVAALIYYSPHLNPVSHRQHPRLFRICEALLTTMTATAASWVLTSYYFNQIPLMFLPANVLLLPLLPIYLSAGLLFTVSLCFGYEPMPLRAVLDTGYDFLLWATDTLSGGEEFVMHFRMPLWGVAGWFVILAVAAWRLNRKNA